MLRTASVIAVVMLAVAGAYGASAQTGAKSPNSAVSFNKDVLPILQKNCQGCHRPGQVAPMSLLTYVQVRPYARAIKTQIAARTMPPWHADPRYGRFDNDRSLKQAEIDTIVAWVDRGAPQGDPKDAPPPIAWPADGWQIQPDMVATLPPYEVAATGTIEWENLAVPSPFKEDTWVTSIEVLPSEFSTVHHLCFDLKPHDPKVTYNRYEWAEVPRDEGGAAIKSRSATPLAPVSPPEPPKETWFLTRDVGSHEVVRRPGRPLVASGSSCYVPGMAVHDYRPYGAARLVRAGSDIMINVHYTTTGKALTNTVRLGFTVAKEAPKKKIVMLAGAIGTLAIPPNDPDYVTPPAQFKLLKDAELIWFSPHMHVRGKEMTWTATYPDGRNETLLRVAPYNYNWQIQYHTRVPIPAGTSIQVVAHYDNSAQNRSNPNPNVWVHEGNQAWEEMMGGGTWFVVDADVNERELTARPARGVPGA